LETRLSSASDAPPDLTTGSDVESRHDPRRAAAAVLPDAAVDRRAAREGQRLAALSSLDVPLHADRAAAVGRAADRDLVDDEAERAGTAAATRTRFARTAGLPANAPA